MNQDQQIEVIERFERGKPTEYSVDGGETWWTKPQMDKIKSLIKDAEKTERTTILRELEKELPKAITNTDYSGKYRLGYYQALKEVKSTINRLLGGEDE